MGYYGDLHGECIYWEDEVLSMSTAIIRIYTHDGFVIAADGRRLNGRTGAIVGEHESKISRLLHPFGVVCCSFAGAVQLTHKGTNSVGLDFSLETAKMAEAITRERPKSLYHYADRLAAGLCEARDGFESNPLNSGDRASTTYLFLDGFFAGHPKRAKIEIPNGTPRKGKEVFPQELIPGRVEGYGSPHVMRVLFGKNETGKLASYRQKCHTGHTMTLSEAVEVAFNVVKAHCDPEALLIDPEVCAAIGGHIHISTITPQNGFEWVRGLEPKS
jgi:hypothetical protein